MFVFLARLSIAAVAAAVLIATGVVLTNSPSGPAPLARVLDGVADAEDLHLRVTKDGHTSEVYVTRANQLRWEESAERYLIAHGANVFRIDEAANRVTPGVADFFRPDREGLDVFGLLGLPRPGPEVLRESQPVSVEVRDGLQVNVYRLELADRVGNPLMVEAEADAATDHLRAVVVRGAAAQVVASFLVVGQGQPVPPEKFVVSDTLAEDGRVGKVADVQGGVRVKPVGYSRWTPLRPNVLLMPGDWVRADVRGANAATLRLLPGASVIVGPGGLIEVVKPTQVRLHDGEVEINPAKNEPIELLGPGGQKLVVQERAFFRIQNEQLAAFPEPKWLAGFKGATANESIGSLVAKVDGRNVPLTVGTHQVSVEVRDQIARTTIEETFVNHTAGQLEGVFHFPLPQDASIAGFAMWIGDEMIEADVVEKQRAREIYEEIMREKRDPGLLEWTGGNVFKARVWPIFPHSEKRIRITYTQVLPLKDNRYRYSYALQSEMLQQHPLKELSIRFQVYSDAPLKSVTSPTHTCRAGQAEHSARLEFAAQEHTPTRDFEAVVEVAEAAPAVTLVPHRRGEDGYFLCQVTPPGERQGSAPPLASRDLVPDGDPLDVRLLCDTSASIDPGQRTRQNAVSAAVLDALTPGDTFNLAACDVDTTWVFDKPQPATPENVRKAHTFLAGRTSLGWTDLDRAFASVLKQCGPKTQVVYLGDGILTSRDANPQAFADRLRAMVKASGTAASFHAVALGNAYEPVVLKTIGGLGGGSVRHVTSDQPPAVVALDLLGEMTTPPVRDLKVEFRGWQTAKVYPEVLPNLVPGSQQILIGRYLPEGKDQAGEVIVSGTRAGKPVQYTARVTLAGAETGNSFLPRLWARMHLDKLLELPQTGVVRDDVIALSEEFGIITPYTSLLVLESDADRERFGVKRRFQMRDGEQFFAKGRDQAGYELARQQMKKAGAWRLGLRRRVLNQFSHYGREPMADSNGGAGFGGMAGGFGGGFVGGGGSSEWGAYAPASRSESLDMLGLKDNQTSLEFYARTFAGDAEVAESLGSTRRNDTPFPGEPNMPVPGGLPYFDGAEVEFKQLGGEVDGLERNLGKSLEVADPWFESAGRRVLEQKKELFDRGLFANPSGRLPKLKISQGFAITDARAENLNGYFGRGPSRPNAEAAHLFELLLPGLPAAARPVDPPKSDWSKEARELARSLLRNEVLAKLDGGLWVVRRSETIDPHDQTITGREYHKAALSRSGWAIRAESDYSPGRVDWCDGKERGAVSTVFDLGRIRKAEPTDLIPPDGVLDRFLLTPLDEIYSGTTARVDNTDGQATLVLNFNDESEARWIIDPERHVVREVRWYRGGEPTSSTVYGDFVEAAGAWWARHAEARNAEGTPISVNRYGPLVALSADEFAKRLQETTVGRDEAIILRTTAPTVAAAREAVAAGKATLEDHFRLLKHYAAYQQWQKAGEQLDAIERLAAKKPGARWLRIAFLQASRRGEELRQRLLAAAGQLRGAPSGGDRVARADHLHNVAQSTVAANELLELSDVLAPVYADSPDLAAPRRNWQQYRISALNNAGRLEEALALEKQIAEKSPRDVSAQTRYAQSLFNRGDHDGALAHLNSMLQTAELSDSEKDSLRGTIANWLEQRGRLSELAEFTAEWTRHQPDMEYAYSIKLSTLVRTGRVQTANWLILKWLRAAQASGKIAAPVQARFRAAVRTATGQGHNLYTNSPDPRWVGELARAARFFASHPQQYALSDLIFQGNQFQKDEIQKARTAVLLRLAREVNELPVPQLVHHIHLVLNGGADADGAVWARLAGDLRKRWASESNSHAKHQLGAALHQLLAGRISGTGHLDFQRRQWKEGPQEYRAQYAASLFESLVAAEWSEPREAEALAFLPELGGVDQPAVRVAALHRLTDRGVQARFEEQRKSLKKPEKLTRTELEKKQSEWLKSARIACAERLAKLDLPGGLQPWADAERLYLLAKADADPKPLSVEVWKFLGDSPKARPETDELARQQWLDGLLADRYLAMALAFAVDERTGTTDRTLRYLDAGIATEPEEASWKAAKFQLLVALDRPTELEAVLFEWVKVGDADGRWRTALGYLLAELGRIPEAIKLVEPLAKSDDLGYTGWRMLADWYMAVNNKGAHEAALVTAYKELPDHQLQQLLQARLNPWQGGSGHVPTELDPEVLRVFAALFEKASQPQNYLHQLGQFYRACRDFRLLAVAADAVIGQSAGTAYPFLGGLQPVLNELRDEAAADELLARIETLRKKVRTATDQRALDLLEMQVRRRAAELLNQPGPHAALALAAMRRAFDRPWADGEPLMMSNLLRDLGDITRSDLAAEQLRELRELHAAAKPKSTERLAMAHNLAVVQRYQSQPKPAIETLETALDEFLTARNGAFPPEANAPTATLVSTFEEEKQYADAETLLQRYLKKPGNVGQERWLSTQLNELYLRALQNDQAVSLGSGAKLYRALAERVVAEATEAEPNHQYELISLLCRVYRSGRERKIPTVDADLKAFAHKALPKLLDGQSGYRDSIVSQVASTLRDLIDAAEAVAFLVDCIEQEPDWLRRNSQDGWSRHGSSLAQWRQEARGLPAGLDRRLLRLALDELRRELQTQHQSNRYLYHARHGYYWQEKEAEFARVAEQVYEDRKKAGDAVLYIADYLFYGCNRPDRAIEILLDAHANKRLDDHGQSRLVQYLHLQERYAESIALLEPLVARLPDVLKYRTQLCTAYFRTERLPELKETFTAAENYFRDKDRWGEGPMATLATTAVQCKLYPQAVVLCGELIPLHQRTQPNRGIGNGTLTQYYQQLAAAHSAMGQTREAIDAASGAVVSWGPNTDRRSEALNSLKSVIAAAPNLDQVVADLDKETAASGLVSPVVRKAVGQVYFDRAQFLPAAAQLQTALSAQPNDAETLKLLIDCYDRMKNPEAAIGQLLRALELSRRDIQRYEDLGNRYLALDRGEEAERAFTSIVEVLPNEAEGHQLLAEIRQRQDRWAEAIPHWEQVAKIRSLEPTGLIGLAAAQLHEKQYDRAAESVDKLKARIWPPHFSDAPKRIAELERQLQDAEKP